MHTLVPAHIREAISPRLEDYDIVARLGQGSFGIVYRVRKRNAPDIPDVALKVIPLALVTAPFRRTVTDFRREAELTVKFSRENRHPNFLHVFACFFSQADAFVWCQMCQGPDLFDRILSTPPNGHLEESDLRKLAHSLCSVVTYLHDYGIIHRDIKPSNVFFALPESPIDSCMLADLSCSVDLATPTTTFTQLTGTPGYTSPEMAAGKPHTMITDEYSLGITLFEAATGRSPFPVADNNETQLLALAMRPVPFPEKYWTHISPMGKHFVRRLLTVNPEERMSAREALQHPWVLGDTKARLVMDLETSSQSTDTEYTPPPPMLLTASRRPQWSHMSLTSQGSLPKQLLSPHPGEEASRLLSLDSSRSV